MRIHADPDPAPDPKHCRCSIYRSPFTIPHTVLPHITLAQCTPFCILPFHTLLSHTTLQTALPHISLSIHYSAYPTHNSPTNFPQITIRNLPIDNRDLHITLWTTPLLISHKPIFLLFATLPMAYYSVKVKSVQSCLNVEYAVLCPNPELP